MIELLQEIHYVLIITEITKRGFMGLFDKLKKKEVPAAEVNTPDEDEVCTVGWDAITDEFERVYPGQTNPKHYGTIIKWILGGNDPLDGISVYDGGDFWHFVSYGLTEIYDKKTIPA